MKYLPTTNLGGLENCGGFLETLRRKMLEIIKGIWYNTWQEVQHLNKSQPRKINMFKKLLSKLFTYLKPRDYGDLERFNVDEFIKETLR